MRESNRGHFSGKKELKDMFTLDWLHINRLIFGVEMMPSTI